MVIFAEAVQNGDAYTPVLNVDGAKFYFTSPRGDDDVVFTKAEAVKYAFLRLEDLHKTVLEFCQASGFVTQL